MKKKSFSKIHRRWLIQHGFNIRGRWAIVRVLGNWGPKLAVEILDNGNLFVGRKGGMGSCSMISGEASISKLKEAILEEV